MLIWKNEFKDAIILLQLRFQVVYIEENFVFAIGYYLFLIGIEHIFCILRYITMIRQFYSLIQNLFDLFYNSLDSTVFLDIAVVLGVHFYPACNPSGYSWKTL